MTLENEAFADMSVAKNGTEDFNFTTQNIPKLFTESHRSAAAAPPSPEEDDDTHFGARDLRSDGDDDLSSSLVWDILHHCPRAFFVACMCVAALWIYCMVSGPMLTGANHYHWISQETYDMVALPSLVCWFIALVGGFLVVPLMGCAVWFHMACCRRKA